ncbi:hypothetical protein RND71_000006 [Anisodus tanguticus]|uniref:DUF4283 domain-containing protein n=1 Tax=Anisodus tanguticus TaxID=243964 RepID=A0AAE1VXB8_9SOLA|nr:hypothetical protein RND71_000006 [Anisodus tanguticus]
MAASVGIPISIDSATRNKTRPSSARVKVEVDLLKVHPKSVLIQVGEGAEITSTQQRIRYDFLPKYCTNCKLQGHDSIGCWKLNPELRPNKAIRRWREDRRRRGGEKRESAIEVHIQRGGNLRGSDLEDHHCLAGGNPRASDSEDHTYWMSLEEVRSRGSHELHHRWEFDVFTLGGPHICWRTSEGLRLRGSHAVHWWESKVVRLGEPRIHWVTSESRRIRGLHTDYWWESEGPRLGGPLTVIGGWTLRLSGLEDHHFDGYGNPRVADLEDHRHRFILIYTGSSHFYRFTLFIILITQVRHHTTMEIPRQTWYRVTTYSELLLVGNRHKECTERDLVECRNHLLTHYQCVVLVPRCAQSADNVTIIGDGIRIRDRQDKLHPVILLYMSLYRFREIHPTFADRQQTHDTLQIERCSLGELPPTFAYRRQTHDRPQLELMLAPNTPNLQTAETAHGGNPSPCGVLSPMSMAIPIKPIVYLHGETTVRFEKKEVEVMIHQQDLNLAVIGKFSHGWPEIGLLRTAIPKQCGLKAEVNIGLLCDRHLLIRCTIAEDYDTLMSRQTFEIKEKNKPYLMRISNGMLPSIRWRRRDLLMDGSPSRDCPHIFMAKPHFSPWRLRLASQYPLIRLQGIKQGLVVQESRRKTTGKGNPNPPQNTKQPANSLENPPTATETVNTTSLAVGNTVQASEPISLQKNTNFEIFGAGNPTGILGGAENPTGTLGGSGDLTRTLPATTPIPDNHLPETLTAVVADGPNPSGMAQNHAHNPNPNTTIAETTNSQNPKPPTGNHPPATTPDTAPPQKTTQNSTTNSITRPETSPAHVSAVKQPTPAAQKKEKTARRKCPDWSPATERRCAAGYDPYVGESEHEYRR